MRRSWIMNKRLYAVIRKIFLKAFPFRRPDGKYMPNMSFLIINLRQGYQRVFDILTIIFGNLPAFLIVGIQIF